MNIRVVCLVDRFWDHENKDYSGTQKTGTMIDISVENSNDEQTKLSPVGIVMLDDGTFQSVPMEFIQKEN